MNLELFIVRKIAFNSRKSFSSFIIRIAIAAVALSLSTMIVATSLVNGFQKEIRNKVLGFWSHIEIVPYSLSSSFKAIDHTSVPGAIRIGAVMRSGEMALLAVPT